MVEKASRLLVEGFVYLRNHPLLLPIIFLHATVGFTSFDALVALLAKENYAHIVSEPLAIGTIDAIRAAGLFIGPLLFIRFKQLNRLLLWLLIGQGVGIWFWALLQPWYYLSFIGLFLTGLFTTSIWSITYSMLQTTTEEGYRGRVIAYNDMLFLLTNAVVALAIGFLADSGIPLWLITGGLGTLFLLSAGYYGLVKKRFTFQ